MKVKRAKREHQRLVEKLALHLYAGFYDQAHRVRPLYSVDEAWTLTDHKQNWLDKADAILRLIEDHRKELKNG